MTGGLRWSIWVVVAFGHVAMLLWLAQAMRPPEKRPGEESVTWVEWIERLPEPAPEIETAPDREPERARVEPPVRPPPVTRRESAPMQAVIEPRADDLLDNGSPREFVAPERDPFSRPVDPEAARFGRRDLPSLPDARLPRIAGGRPPDAPLPEQRFRAIGPKEVIETAAMLLGLGGPNAMPEAPCGGRMNGGDFTAESFSPDWQRGHGCGDARQAAGFDGTFDQPPGTVR